MDSLIFLSNVSYTYVYAKRVFIRARRREKGESKMRIALALSLVIYFAACEPLFGLLADSRNPLVAATAEAQESSSSELFSPEQLDNLLAPIALYPDPLLAQVLPAATFVDQIDEASRWMRAYKNINAIDDQPWDVSVKAVAHYPSVLYMMSDQIDWTTSLGQAYVYQSTDVMTSIQRLRALAYSAGNLVSNQQQQVIVDGNYIRIDPFQPQLIYVPTYDPNIVYAQRSSYFGGPSPANLISFGVGFAIGAWLNCDYDWPGHRIYYHGWQGGGWVARSRPNVRITNVYVNDNYRHIQVNRNVGRQNVNYNNLNRYSSVHRDVNYNNVARNNRAIPANPNAGNKIIRRNMDVTDPRIDTYRGHRPAQQPVTPADRPSPTEQPRLAPTPTQENRPPAAQARPAPSTREEERPPASQARTQPAKMSQREPLQIARPMPQQPPGEVQRPPSSVFGGNKSGLDPRATSQRGQVSRERANQPPARPAANVPTRPANPSSRPEPGKRP
jgi:Protein of unknown function (DUF3300)